MNEIVIWHNPRCSKSRQTLALLDAHGAPYRIVKYLEDTPSAPEIKSILSQLGFKTPQDMMRKGEAVYKDMGLKDVDSSDVLVDAMVENPILIERPIVSNGRKAVIGRPPEAVKAVFCST